METYQYEIWLFIAYCAGTIFGIWAAKFFYVNNAVQSTIDTLIEGGFVKTRPSYIDGEIELIPLDNKET